MFLLKLTFSLQQSKKLQSDASKQPEMFSCTIDNNKTTFAYLFKFLFFFSLNKSLNIVSRKDCSGGPIYNIEILCEIEINQDK